VNHWSPSGSPRYLQRTGWRIHSILSVVSSQGLVHCTLNILQPLRAPERHSIKLWTHAMPASSSLHQKRPSSRRNDLATLSVVPTGCAYNFTDPQHRTVHVRPPLWFQDSLGSDPSLQSFAYKWQRASKEIQIIYYSEESSSEWTKCTSGMV